MGIPTGLGLTFGVAQEVTVGTAQTVNRFLVIDNESLALKKTTATSKGLLAKQYQQAKRRVLVAREGGGKVKMDVVDKGLGLLFKNMLGSSATATQQGATTAYLQTHTPGPLVGLSMTLQKGVPQTNGTIQPFTYKGSKITDWQLSVAQGQIASLELTFDSWDEDPSVAYQAASYTAANPLHFGQGQLLVGGTPSTTAGVTTVAGGAAPTGVVKSVTVKSSNPLNAKRFNLGSTLKAEQLDNNFRALMGEAEIEFATMADAYTAMRADTPTAIQFNLVGLNIQSTYNAFVDTLLPQVFFDDAPVVVGGPDVVTVKTKFTALDDGADNPIQIQYQSTDTAL